MSGQPPPPQPPPGWNDPPTYASSGAPSSAGTGLKLNKRVGFPTTSTQPPPQAGPKEINTKIHDAGASAVGANMPPPPPMMTTGALPAATAPPPTLENLAITPKESINEEVKPQDVDTVVSKLESALSNQAGIDQRKAADIKKRIGAMATKWKAGGLNRQVELGMSQIADFLEAGNGKKAEEVQVKLMIDWPAVCSPWLVGIKHLITTAKDAQENVEVDSKTEASETQIPLMKVN